MSDLRAEISEAQRKELLAVVREFCAEARRMSLEFYEKQNFSSELKGDKSIVTEADKAVEVMLRERIGKRFPGHGIIGEELPDVNVDADFTWSLDPIDGTVNFANRIPTWGTMVCLRYKKMPLVGLIDHPVFDACYYACYGLGAFCEEGGKERRLKIVDTKTVELNPNEIIATSTRINFGRTGEEKVFDEFVARHQQTRIYHDCYAHTQTAEGNLGATLEYNLRVWDIAPTQVLVEEAGGAFKLIKVVPKTGEQPFESAVFGKPKVVQAICAMRLF